MDFSNLPEQTRSFRRFREEQRIPMEHLLSIVNAARLAPCAANLQLLRFSIINSPHECSKVFPCIKWAGYLADWDGPSEGERPSAYVSILAPDEEKPFTPIDTGIAAAYIVLAARDAGYGSCMILSFDREIVSKAISAPGYSVKLVIALGVPGEEVVLEPVKKGIEYWRDEDGRHHVPKLDLDSLVVKTDLHDIDMEDL